MRFTRMGAGVLLSALLMTAAAVTPAVAATDPVTSPRGGSLLAVGQGCTAKDDDDLTWQKCFVSAPTDLWIEVQVFKQNKDSPQYIVFDADGREDRRGRFNPTVMPHYDANGMYVGMTATYANSYIHLREGQKLWLGKPTHRPTFYGAPLNGGSENKIGIVSMRTVAEYGEDPYGTRPPDQPLGLGLKMSGYSLIVQTPTEEAQECVVPAWKDTPCWMYGGPGSIVVAVRSTTGSAAAVYVQRQGEAKRYPLAADKDHRFELGFGDSISSVGISSDGQPEPETLQLRVSG
jgi:hypothetical protein